MSVNVTNLLYLVTIVLLHPGAAVPLSPATRGAATGSARPAWLLAIVVTLDRSRHVTSGWAIVVGDAIGGGFGAVAARRVKMTAMPQMVALFNGVGGGAAALISLAEFHASSPSPGSPTADISVAIVLSALIGSISFAGSMVAFAKLQELIGGRPITYPGQQIVQRRSCSASGWRRASRSSPATRTVAALGADRRRAALRRPVRAADRRRRHAGRDLAPERVHRPRRAATGFELENNVLIVSGMLVGASGTLLTLMMGRAMNRSIANVLFGAFGQVSAEQRRRRQAAPAGAPDDRRGRRRHARVRAEGRHRPRLRHGGRAGPARRARARRPARGTGRRSRRTRSIPSPAACRAT